MKKWYVCKKPFALAKWEVGKRYECDDSEPATLELVEAGFIEPEPLSEEQARYNKWAQEFGEQNQTKNAELLTDVVTKVFERLQVATSQGPLNVRVVEEEADKTKGFGEFLQCVGILGVQNAPHHLKQAAGTTLETVYKAHPDTTFGERWAKSQADMGTMTLKAALAEASGITGGYTVPTQYAMDLLQLSAEDTLLVGQTDEYALAGRELKMPVLDQTTAPTAGQTAYFGGVVATWTAEAATRAETEPKFKEITLVANELSGYALASRNVLFDNKVALEQRLTRLFAGAIGWFRDFAYLQGDGVGKPRGIMNAPATLSVTRASGGHISYADLAKMLGKLLPQSMKSAFWVMQQSVLQDFLQMTDASSRLIIQPYYPNYVPGKVGGPATVPPVMMMLGLPIKTTEKVSTLGTAGDLMLIDPKQYFTATRQDVEIAASEHFKFLNNQVTYRFIFRGDGQPWLDAPFTLQDGTTQISPFVKLV